MSVREPVAGVVDLGSRVGAFSRRSWPSWRREIGDLADEVCRRLLLAVPLLLCASASAFAQVAEVAPVDASGLACAEFRGDVSRILATEPDALQVNDLLFEASRKGCASLLGTLEKAGASPLARDRRGDEALTLAARMGREGMVAALLNVDAATRALELDRANTEGSTPLIVAARAGRAAVAKRLVEAGASVDAANAQGETALSAAAFTANFDLVALLLSHGAKPDTLDRTGKGPILYAAARGADRIVAALIDAGVDPNVRYGGDTTALMWAAGYADTAPADGALRAVRLLIARGAKIDLVDDRGRSSLMVAASLGHADVVQELIAAGADRKLKDKTGKSAQDLAGNADLQVLLAAP